MITSINEYRKLIESFNTISDSEFERAYQSRINRERKNLLTKVATNPNYCFILNKNMLQDTDQGQLNSCETNAWKYVKNKLEQGLDNFFPVGGFLFEGDSFFPIEHWWVYNQELNKYIEVTPSSGGKISCYAGIINFDIQDKIKNSKYFHDVDFFKGGNVYDWYFN